MAYPTSDYPGGYDSFPDPDTTLDGTPLHSDLHESHNDAIEKIQAELGLTPSSSWATVSARLDAQFGPVRARKHRDGLSVGSTGTTLLFGGSATGTLIESHADIPFTTDGTNGYWTATNAGTYSVVMHFYGSGSLTGAIANFIIAGGTTQIPTAGGAVRNQATVIRYLDAATTIAFSFTHTTGSARTLDVCRFEITRLTPS